MSEQLLKPKEVTARLAISRTQLYRLFWSGQIKPCRIGQRGVRVKQSELDRFVSSL